MCHKRPGDDSIIEKEAMHTAIITVQMLINK